jgi:hypothetical protein
MPSGIKAGHRKRTHRDARQWWLLGVCVCVVIAVVVGLILLLNSKVFIEPR